MDREANTLNAAIIARASDPTTHVETKAARDPAAQTIRIPHGSALASLTLRPERRNSRPKSMT
jgi:hypothetical protein